MRLSQVAKILNKGTSSVADVLSAKGFKVDSNPNTKINPEQLEVLAKEYKATELLNSTRRPEPPVAVAAPPRHREEDVILYRRDDAGRPIVDARNNTAPERTPAVEAETPKPASTGPKDTPPTAQTGLPGLKVLGKIDLNARPTAKAPETPKPTPPEAKLVEPPVRPTPAVDVPKPVEAPSVPPVSEAEVFKPTPAPPVEVKSVSDKPPKAEEPISETPKTAAEQATPTPPAKTNTEGPTARKEAPKPNDRPAREKENRTNQRPANPPKPKKPPVDASTDETAESAEPTQTIRAAGSHQLRGLKILDKIDLPTPNPRQGSGDKRGKRKRIRGGREATPGSTGQPGNRPDRAPREGQGQSDRAPVNRTPSDRSTRPPAQGDRSQPPTNRTGSPAQGGSNANRSGRSRSGGGGQNRSGSSRGGGRREAPTQADVNKAIQQTRDRMRGNSPNRGADRRRDRRSQREEDRRLMTEQEELEAKTLRVTEFVSANDLASLMDVSISEVISVCMNLGMFVSINQRLDAEAITVIADEFDYDVEFISAEDETEAGVDVDDDDPEDLQPRAPIVTIMGHVDHGKTSLLDYIRRAKVAAGEAGGITQHIGAYSVKTEDDRMITFLDTPGHEAFTAMRARGAKVTDVVIIVIAADDSVMPQTREAINHAQVAGVPIVFAFSKVDKPGADSEKIRTELAAMNFLVEEWGGKYQAQEISSKSGMGVDELLEKVLLEAELLELKANPDRRALGTVIEASLDKGRGYISTVLIENGTLNQGDIMLVGAHYGRIRAMTNDRGERIKEAGPAKPVQILGLPGAPQAGDKFNVMETEREAREIANKREQLLREQTLRTRKHITLEEIGRRKAIGTFKELNVIVKGDVDGSVEALSDSLLQLSTEEVQVNIIHKAVGQISESDILLASASDAIIVGFQVRPSASARKLAEQEQIEIRLYSIIYNAINEVKDAMEGLLAPTVEEVIVGNVEVRDVFKITKVGTVAGCYVTDGTVKRNNKIRIIRDFIVVHTGEISALKRFKDDVSEVRSGYECGLSIKNFNDIEIGDVIESFELKEVKRTL